MTLPAGWTQETRDGLWTVRDEAGKVRVLVRLSR